MKKKFTKINEIHEKLCDFFKSFKTFCLSGKDP